MFPSHPYFFLHLFFLSICLSHFPFFPHLFLSLFIFIFSLFIKRKEREEKRRE
jgi:hypothetical protein